MVSFGFDFVFGCPSLVFYSTASYPIHLCLGLRDINVFSFLCINALDSNDINNESLIFSDVQYIATEVSEATE